MFRVSSHKDRALSTKNHRFNRGFDGPSRAGFDKDLNIYQLKRKLLEGLSFSYGAFQSFTRNGLKDNYFRQEVWKACHSTPDVLKAELERKVLEELGDLVEGLAGGFDRVAGTMAEGYYRHNRLIFRYF